MHSCFIYFETMKRKLYFCKDSFVNLNHMKTIALEEWKNRLDEDQNAVVIDVRSKDEFEENHFPGAHQINVQEPNDFMDGIEKLDKNKNYYLYCNSGNRSTLACQVMEFNGLCNVFSLEGGLESWLENAPLSKNA